MLRYTAKENYSANSNSILDEINIQKYVDTSKYNLKNGWINVGGWQSWNPGFEIEPGKKQDSLKCHLIKGWNKYLIFPETEYAPSKNIVLGQFVTYIRWENFYLVFASIGNVNNLLPPVQFIFNRNKNTVLFEIYDKGNEWKTEDLQAEIKIFTAESYFECQKKLKEIFNCRQFDSIAHLGNSPSGWESWYNHYSNIDEKLILENLKALRASQNIISMGNFSSKIFQIDDGWEEALGDWYLRNDRFPNGFTNIVEKIDSAGYVPGLWLAPFIIDERSNTAKNHPEWILKDDKGNKVIAGFNPLWGKKGNFYCLDLTNEEVITHLSSLMERVINEWGFRYIKLDFLYAGMLYGSFKNKIPSYKAYTRAIEILTKIKETSDGKKVAYLGCGVPFEASFKYFPLTRIGCDTLEHWKNSKLRFINWNGRNEAYLNVKDTLGHALWNRTIFANDPDVIFIRENNCTLSKEEKKLIAFVNVMFGSQLMYSDDPGAGTSENEFNFTEEILDFYEAYKNENFGIRQISKDVYEIFNEAKTIKGLLDIGKKRKITF